MTEGQDLALEQLKEIAVRDGYVLDIEDIVAPSEGKPSLFVEISLHCGDIEHAPGGLKLRARERFWILVPPQFPFQKPEVSVGHTRFAGAPHVQWSRHLCLYQAPQTEWNVEDGAFGFVERLHLWLRRAAVNQLEAEGEPLHPPVAYCDGIAKTPVVVRKDAPSVDGLAWAGYAQLRIFANRADLVDWGHAFEKQDGNVLAPALLLSTWMPWEFPSTVGELLVQLMDRGIDLRGFVYQLQFAALMNDDGTPLFAVLGTPMRGTKGGDVKQHLAVWYIEPEQTKYLSLSLLKDFTQNDLVKELSEEAYQRVIEWAKAAKVHWCRVMEARPEIAVRRDSTSPMSWFRDRQVLLMGCGALGGNVAVYLAQSGVRRLVLKDWATVKPGVLVRQPYADGDIGISKVVALAEKLKSLRPDLEVLPKNENLTATPIGPEWSEGCEVVIDCTASAGVQARIELLRRASEPPPLIVSMIISRLAQHGIATVAHSSFTGGPADLYQRTKLEVCKRPWLDSYADEFYPLEDRTEHFQPEPGCSDPTFVGSGADAATLSGALINLAAEELQRATGDAASFLFTQPTGSLPDVSASAHLRFSWSSDYLCWDSHKGFEVRLSRGAWLDMQSAINKSSREFGADVETGGLLYGKRDDALKIMWVAEATPPPPDSRRSALEFVCGVEGAALGYELRKKQFRNSLQCLGTWHTHPMCRPLPSPRDLAGVVQILTESSVSASKTLLLIAGLTEKTTKLGAYVFARADFMRASYEATIGGRLTTLCNVAERKPRVGLALSGGGSRAIAFHLGCLRALHDRGVLDQLQVVSAVSGGSVIAALYMYSGLGFDHFEAAVLELLRRGLVQRSLKALAFAGVGVESLLTSAVSGVAALGARIVSRQPPWRRWRSRTHALEQALDDALGGLSLSAPTRNNVPVIFNACELRTGNAFRYQSGRIACSALGVSEHDTKLAHAVAASAAYPVFLPSFDEEAVFSRKGKQRTIITDGGVFDNLGISCMEPGRDERFSEHVFRPEYIICCNAGQGPLDNEHLPYGMYSRISRSMEIIFKKVQDASMHRLHEHVASQRLKGFILPYLGQSDKALPYSPPDLVPRSEVAKYPTNFSPMKDRDIELLATRGEQLTAHLLSYYIPSL